MKKYRVDMDEKEWLLYRAAPDLVKACNTIRLTDKICRWLDANDPKALEQLRGAISKAHTKEPLDWDAVNASQASSLAVIADLRDQISKLQSSLTEHTLCSDQNSGLRLSPWHGRHPVHH